MKQIFLRALLVCFVTVLIIDRAYSQDTVSAETAMQHYLNNGDSTYHWELKDSFEVDGTKAYDLLLTSQKWREFTWTHQLTVFVPKENKYDGALLFITGGH